MADRNDALHPGDAGQDPKIAERMQRQPGDEDAKLDEALDESMDASDPPSNTQPGCGEPVPSSNDGQAKHDKAPS